MSNCPKEFQRHVDNIHNGAPFVQLFPIGVNVHEHFKVGETVISYQMGMCLSHHYHASELEKVTVKLISGKEVEAWRIVYTPRHLVKAN